MSINRHRRRPLYAQLRWFTQLRWLAAAGVIVGGFVDHRFAIFGAEKEILAVGVIIGAYNAVLTLLLPRVNRLTLLAMAQLLLDMVCLTMLITWTGGVRSPLIGFFVFHMVFASLLLRTATAYASAVAACVLIACGLALSHKWPGSRVDELLLVGMQLTLILTVMLTNRITLDLRNHRRRLMKQNRRVRAMTHELRRQQEALVQHEKMVAMGQMAAGVTHEITNPLASIDSVLQLALRRPERVRPEMMQTLREQVARISQIIQQMKSFAHPQESQFQRMRINDVVEQALTMLNFDRRLKSVEIRREFDACGEAIPLLAQALQQVLVNLIINALDAMAACEHPLLIIRTRRSEGCWTIDVIDNGHGVAPANMQRLFEPFFTTKPLGKGTGLGLSISYSLMQKQGGSISVRSQEGKGTTFTFRVPLDAARTHQSIHGQAESAAPR
jgi:C4-dicarboxylate-specific signal transduction histidine kinase